MNHHLNNKQLLSLIGRVLLCVFIAHTIDSGSSQVTAQNNTAVQFGEFVIQDEGITVPEFPGGQIALLEYLKKNMKYPEDALKESVQGKVIVQCIIEKDGSISNPKIVNRITSMADPVDSVKVRMFDAEAIRLISAMPKWTPGKKNGEPCRILYNIPVNFKLDSNASNNSNSPVQFIRVEEL